MKRILSISFIALYYLSAGQNLVANGSFEFHKKCPHFVSQFPYADGWSSPSVGTPDYYNICCTSITVAVPHNTFGYQIPRTGVAYAGAFLYEQAAPDTYREYITTQLKEPLKKGIKYQVKFYISLAEESEIAVSNIEVLFTKEALKSIGAERLDYVPQLSYKNNMPVTDTSKWTEMLWTYTAKGNEAYITIGNFTKAAKCKMQSVHTMLPGTFLNAYYYFDDVCVEEIKDTTPCKCIEDTLAVRPTKPIPKDVLVSDEKETNPGQLVIAPNENIVLEHIVFETNKAELLPPSYPELDELLDYAMKHENAKMEISGYTDSTGDEQKNVKLSEARAKAVADYLINKGIAKERIVYAGYGSANPVADNKTKEGKAKNRRVEFLISGE